MLSLFGAEVDDSVAVAEALRQRWFRLFYREFPLLRPQSIEKAWQRLIGHYREPHRHYHTEQHLYACFHWFDLIRPQLKQPLAVELAIWFHDVIYDVKAGDNELQSAHYAVTALTNLRITGALVQQVYDLVLLTRHPGRPHNHDEALLLDIDLAILAADEKTYLAYEGWIRREYQHVPLLLYKIGRKRMLKAFLNQKALYHSPYFHEMFESRARENLQSGIAQLKLFEK